MSETPINLNKVRKARTRAADKARAEANTVAFGRSKAQRNAEREARARAARDLDGKAIETSGDGDETP